MILDGVEMHGAGATGIDDDIAPLDGVSVDGVMAAAHRDDGVEPESLPCAWADPVQLLGTGLSRKLGSGPMCPMQHNGVDAWHLRLAGMGVAASAAEATDERLGVAAEYRPVAEQRPNGLAAPAAFVPEAPGTLRGRPPVPGGVPARCTAEAT